MRCIKIVKIIKPFDLDKALRGELTLYREEVIRRVNAVGKAAIKKLVKRTKDGAPVDSGDFKNSLTSKETVARNGMKSFTLYAKAPHHRIFHLLVHGHEKTNGGRIPSDPFLNNALEEVLPEYEKNVEEAVKGD